MRITLTLFFCLFLFFGFSQNQHSGILIDKETKESIEFVGIFNDKDYTVSNADGRFSFTSLKDSIIFYRVGYDKLTTRFNQLKDTIFLSKSVLELNEVVVTNEKTTWRKIGDSLSNNYSLEPYKERFFLRCILKLNDTIVRIQDIQGKLKRKTLFYPESFELKKKDFEIEITNLRKIGIDTDEKRAYFSFPSFYQTIIEFITINYTGEAFDLTESQFDNENKTKLEFVSNPTKKVWRTKGHYIINNTDNAILLLDSDLKSTNAKFKKNMWIRYRTLQSKKNITFAFDDKANKYFLKLGKHHAAVEITDKESSYKNIYSYDVIMTTFDNFGDYEVKSNINEHKDIFKLKFPYNPEYWNSQNQLLLTEEMQRFITKMGVDNKEFKVKNNMN